MAERTELETLLRNAPYTLVGARIKRARTDLGLSHDRLGERMGAELSSGIRQTLIGYEQAEHKPRLPMLLRIAEATGKDARWFVDPELAMSPFQAGREAA